MAGLMIGATGRIPLMVGAILGAAALLVLSFSAESS